MSNDSAMEYNFNEIEKKWRARWKQEGTFRASNNSEKPKYYALDMFPYPSGAGLHVGHPLGYIASDIVSRYKRLQGYNVLHPMGFDAFGLPAEQYAIQTGQHPAKTTEQNINRYIDQLTNIGFSYDWDRMVSTADPGYYKWTQWMFLLLFNSWYDDKQQKARPVSELIALFEQQGNAGYDQPLITGGVEQLLTHFTAAEWKNFSKQTQSNILMCYRLAYQSFAYVNWCEALGTVLANDEVKDGVSERGGHPVERREMRQWFLRTTAYAERLLNDLDTLSWSDAMKEMQRNWIGRSEGALVRFALQDREEFLEIFTTRPDTIFGVTFMVLAPESDWVNVITSPEQKAAVEAYVNEARNRSERERMADVKRVSGVFTGAYVMHPFTGNPIPVWIGDYVLAGYGTGAVMAVPGHDGRDFRFATHFGLPVPRVIAGPDGDTTELKEAYEAKEGMVINSGFITGMSVKDAIQAVIRKVEEDGIGERQVNYRLRDANFSRQRYWGEPFPIYYEDGIPTAIPAEELPLELPAMEDFKPTGRPEGPLAKLSLEEWNYNGHPLETDTMPGFAGSSWYFLRYMDAGNKTEFAGKDALHYWKDVDLYIGGTEHAVGHLLYSRFFHKVLFDYGYVPTPEPFKKLVNQGMIQGNSAFIRIRRAAMNHEYLWQVDRHYDEPRFAVYSKGLLDEFNTVENCESEFWEYLDARQIHVPLEYVDERTNTLNIERFHASDYRIQNIGSCYYLTAEGLTDETGFYPFAERQKGGGGFTLIREVEKMSKSKYNVVNPDDICETYGADTLRLYEMFLGPIEQAKPWSTHGIEGVHKFLKKYWRTCIDKDGNLALTDGEPDARELKALHKTIKKISEDIENLSLNTCISAFMICLNELNDLGCLKKAIFRDFTILLSPFAPHIAEEIWERMGYAESISFARFPEFKQEYLVENSFSYPVSFNGKVRYNVDLPLGIPNTEIEAAALAHEQAARWLDGKAPKKVIVVPGRIVNIVV